MDRQWAMEEITTDNDEATHQINNINKNYCTEKRFVYQKEKCRITPAITDLHYNTMELIYSTRIIKDYSEEDGAEELWRRLTITNTIKKGKSRAGLVSRSIHNKSIVQSILFISKGKRY